MTPPPFRTYLFDLDGTAVAPTFAEAQAASRAMAEEIDFEGKQFRRDIGWREAARR